METYVRDRIYNDLINRPNRTKIEQFQLNMIEMEDVEAIYMGPHDFSKSMVIYEELFKRYKIKIKTLDGPKGCNVYNYDSMEALFAEIGRNHRYRIYTITMMYGKIIVRAIIQKDDPKGYYRRKAGIL